MLYKSSSSAKKDICDRNCLGDFSKQLNGKEIQKNRMTVYVNIKLMESGKQPNTWKIIKSGRAPKLNYKKLFIFTMIPSEIARVSDVFI